MNPRSISPRQASTDKGFTLVELLVSIALLSFLVILLANMLSAVNRAWVTGEQRVENFQNGRAVLDLISRDLAQAAISPGLQFVQDPDLPPDASSPPNSSSLFWQAPLTSNDNGNLCEVGYFLSNYELKRFFVPPDNTPNSDYDIYNAKPQAAVAPWVENFADKKKLSSVVSDGVVGFWVRCFDSNGDPIPWMTNNMKYNSAGQFQPAIPGQANSFQWLPSSTTQMHLLPASVEVTIIVVDSQTLNRNPTIPAIPPSTDPASVPDAIKQMNQALIAANITTARTFTTRIYLANAVK